MTKRTILFEDKENRKCGGCNWEAVRLYYLSDGDKENAVCAHCFLDFVINKAGITL